LAQALTEKLQSALNDSSLFQLPIKPNKEIHSNILGAAFNYQSAEKAICTKSRTILKGP
jgi:hypothetical protein